MNHATLRPDNCPLRVLYTFPWVLGDSGVGTTAWHQVYGLARRGVSLTVLCGGVSRRLPPSVRIINVFKSPVRRRLLTRRGRLVEAAAWFDRKVARFLQGSKATFDAVHLWPLASMQTISVARQAGIPAFLERPNCHTRFAQRRVREVLVRNGFSLPRTHSHADNSKKLAREESEYESASALLCPSEFVAGSHKMHGVPESKCLVHQYGFDPSIYFPPKLDDRKSEAIRFVFLGRLEPRKGVHDLVDAWNKVDSEGRAQLRIVGPAVPQYLERLAQAARGNVEFLPATEMPASLFRRSDVFVLPSYEEGSALATFEARACGCAAIVSDSAGARGKTGVEFWQVPSGDVEGLAEAISAHLDSDFLGDRRVKSLARIPDFTWDEAARILETCYRKLDKDQG